MIKKNGTIGYRAMSLGLCIAILTGGAAQAESLESALVSAYLNNPILQAQRAGLRATDEDVAQALSGYRPSISGNASIDHNESDNFFAMADDGSMEPTDPTDVLTAKRYGVTIDQPVFRSFRTVNSVKEAKTRVFAGRAQLTSVEQDVLLATVAAYVDVVRDQAVLELRRNNVQVLGRQLEASQDRFEVGEITRTDVAQSEARRAGAVSGRIAAEAALAASRAAYVRIVGNAPGTLEQPPELPILPASEEAALQIALMENPVLEAARLAEQASGHAVSAAKSELGPEISVSARYSRDVDTFVDGFASDTKAIMASASIPIYQSGAVSSRIRQAKQIKSQRRIEVLQAERETREDVRNAWENLRASTSTIGANEAQVEANNIALEGVRQEADVGSRTTLDVLDAEQELLDSQVELVRAQRDEYVAAFALLVSMGRATAAALNLPVEQYNPNENYDRARNTWFGWSVGD
ncbi:MAG: TolC family outer membrane protein [Alphaproteobacteria bacterium]